MANAPAAIADAGGLPARPRGRLGRLLILSCLSGVLLGIATRAAMRFVALESGLPVGLSIGGTLEVIAFGMLLGAPVAAAFLWTSSSLRSSSSIRRRQHLER